MCARLHFGKHHVEYIEVEAFQVDSSTVHKHTRKRGGQSNLRNFCNNNVNNNNDNNNGDADENVKWNKKGLVAAAYKEAILRSSLTHSVRCFFWLKDRIRLNITEIHFDKKMLQRHEGVLRRSTGYSYIDIGFSRKSKFITAPIWCFVKSLVIKVECQRPKQLVNQETVCSIDSQSMNTWNNLLGIHQSKRFLIESRPQCRYGYSIALCYVHNLHHFLLPQFLM